MKIVESIDRFRSLLRQFTLGEWHKLSKLQMALIYPIRLLAQVFKELVQDRGLVRASSLAFTSVLSVVPTLTVATTLPALVGISNSTLLDVLRPALPTSATGVLDHLSTFIERQSGTLSSVGLVVLVVLAVALFNNIEHAFNDIWRVTKRRPLLNKFLTFHALITLGPVLTAASIGLTAKLQFAVEQLPFGAFVSVLYKLLPLAIGTVLFTAANKLLPYTHVTFRAAAISGFVTAWLFEVSKTGFNLYVNHLLVETYSKVYGAIGLIPIFLVWVYICWVLVLFGAELSYTIQNFKKLVLPQHLRELAEQRDREFDPLLAIELFTPIARSFKHAKGAISLEDAATFAVVPKDVARTVISALVRHGFVLEVDTEGVSAYLPARPLKDIGLHELLAAVRPKQTHFHDELLNAMRTVYRVKEFEMLGGVTAESLVESGERRSAQDVIRRLLEHAEHPSLHTIEAPSKGLNDSATADPVAVEADEGVAA